MAGPVYAKGSKPLKVPVTTIVSLFKMLAQEQKLDEFLAAASSEGTFVEATPDAINFVKKFLFDHALHEKHAAAATMASVASDDDCPGGECPHIQH